MTAARICFAVCCITCTFLATVVWAGLYLGLDIRQPLYELIGNALFAIWCALQMDRDAAKASEHTTCQNPSSPPANAAAASKSTA